MASREIVENFINDPDRPKVFVQPKQDPKTRLLSITSISSGPDLSARDQPFTSSPVSVYKSTNPSSSPTRSVLSRGDSRSSYTSTAPSDDTGSVVESFRAMSIGDLPCLLHEITGCQVRYDLSHREDWYLHSVSHYMGENLPTHAMCIFCDTVFDSNIPARCWLNRMYHIADHFADNMTLEQSRPDFQTIKDMREKNCISEDLYKYCFLHTERPPCKDLRAHDYIPDAIQKKQKAVYDSENRVTVSESRQEVRDRQRHKRPMVVGSKKKSKPKIILK